MALCSWQNTWLCSISPCWNGLNWCSGAPTRWHCQASTLKREKSSFISISTSLKISHSCSCLPTGPCLHRFSHPLHIFLPTIYFSLRKIILLGFYLPSYQSLYFREESGILFLIFFLAEGTEIKILLSITVEMKEIKRNNTWIHTHKNMHMQRILDSG